ncbi:MAG: hypothetical protein JRN15_09855 [Nitrososphaerota archaeon]|nr:hypothetical protein [Nitrososphaerota archaeon]
MRKTRLIVSACLFAVLSPLVVLPVAASSGGTTQFATYNITLTNATKTTSFVVNESITPSTNGMSNLALQLVSSMSNLSYSRLVNSTYAMFPVLPSVGNQSFSYQSHNYSIAASIVQTGKSSATLSGAPYTTTDYAFSANASLSGSQEFSVSGDLVVLPSGLVDSAQVMYKGATVQAQLVSTNLSLSSNSPASSTMRTATIAGGASAIFGVGALVFYKHRSTSHSSQSRNDKPLYHVD